MTRIIVTGGTGLIGSALVKKLKKLKHDVHILSRSPDNLENIIQDDIRNPNLDLSEYDIIYHLAAIPNVKKCEEQKELAWDINVNGTLNLLQKLNKNQHFIFSSTAQVYDKFLDVKHKEDEIPKPQNFYALTKTICEELIKYYSDKTGFTYVILRFFNVYAQTQNEGYIIPDIIKKYKTQETVEVYNPLGVIDLIHLDDIISALFKAIRLDGLFNVCSGKPMQIAYIYEMIKKILKSNSKDKIILKPKTNFSGDLSRLQKASEWEPKISFEEAIADIVKCQ